MKLEYQEAVEEIRRLAGARYWTLDHVTDSRGEVRIHGYIQIDGAKGHALPAHTYREAIANVRRMLGLAGSDPAPEDDVVITVLEPIETKVRELWTGIDRGGNSQGVRKVSKRSRRSERLT